MSVVTAFAAVLGWVGAVATGSGALSVLLLLVTLGATAFGVRWVVHPASLPWWSGLVVLLVAIGPACYAFVILSGVIAHVAGLFTFVAIAFDGMTVLRRYELPPLGR